METSVAMLCIALVFGALANPVGAEILCDYESLSPSLNNDGYIRSPGYPLSYSPSLCIIWNYSLTPGTRINIRFIDVDIPTYTDYCSNDFLIIGPINEHIYCGNIESKSVEPYTAVTTELKHWLHIVFNSTSVEAKGRGFQIYYQFFDATLMMSTTKAYHSLEESEVDSSDCHFVFTSKTGEITANRTVLECLNRIGKVTWLIYYSGLGSNNAKYEIIFEHCSLPYLDTLKVYDGLTNTDITLGIYTESLCPNFLMSSHNAILIEYHRGRTEVKPNLKLQFILTGFSNNDDTRASIISTVSTASPGYQYSDQCAFQLTNKTGEITSDYLYSKILQSGVCTWLLHVPVTEGQKVVYTLTIDRLQLSPDSILSIYDGANMSTPILWNSYSVGPSLALKSSQSSIFIYYNPRNNLLSVGLNEVFRIIYSTDYACAANYLPCGYGEFDCYSQLNQCDHFWHCPLHGGDERGCFADCLANFSCGYRSGCYSESERCNGRGICPNNIDEKNCSEELCSSKKGLYLCSNGHCVYETKRCDKMDDCLDNSDEEGCSIPISPRIILAAVASCLICALLLVIAMGCVCKVYRMRIRSLQPSRHETPLSRQLSEMLHQRAPPPPYHEAMLSSRPYIEPYLELNSSDEHQSESSDVFNTNYQENADPSEQTQRNNGQRHRRNQAVNENQYPSSRLRPESGRLVDVGTLLLFSERLEDVPYEVTADGDPPGYTESLYSETHTSLVAESCSNDSVDEFSHDSTWHGGFENLAFSGDDNTHISPNGESIIQMDMMSSSAAQIPAFDQASPLSYTRNSDGMSSFPERHHGDCGDEDCIDKDGISAASTSLSVDSTRMEVEEESKIQENMNVIDEDSDSDCILADNDADDNYDDSTDSDSAFILGRV